MKNLLKVDKWINVAIFFWLFVNMILDSYSNFYCKYMSKKKYYAIQSTKN